MQKIKTGIYGGSFNPIHNGHIAIAKRMLELAGLDEIWLIVSPQNPLKTAGSLLDDRLRLEMTQRALAPYPQLTASDYEFRLPRPSYMWNTLQRLSADYPHREFTLLIGADNWTVFDRW
ncbi:MAG: nicotinate-nicotinamide nucleotide adenylyltransferase, partial [Prevotella sp.]|nr:nicotinate-nicotinamide nucleotide adenylyltransferase [Prevotella sp.]